MPKSRIPQPCGVANCDRPHEAKGYCDLHYERLRRHGDPLAFKRELNPKCSVPDCGKPRKGKGYCCMHLKRFINHGDPLMTRALKTKPLCSVDGCDRIASSAGFCQKHYHNQWRWGDPIAKQKDKALRYYREFVLTYDGEECLIWKYTRDVEGYARMQLDGKTVRVHRQACIDTYGPPPTPEHVAAHFCGNGHLGCCAPKHSGWCTVAENASHRKWHGTDVIGSRNPSARFTEDDVRQIRKLNDYISNAEIATLFGTSKEYISHIIRRRVWKSIV